jgi:hypothetical protein
MVSADGLARDSVTGALVTAATTAGAAPSIHNTQPWRWRIHDRVADLYANPERQLAVSDPLRWMLLLSCGAALHHARVTLAGEGYRADVTLLPEAGDIDHLARVTVTGREPVTAQAIRLAQTIGIRHTDRRPTADEAVPQPALTAISGAGDPFGVRLVVLDRDGVIELAAAIDRAQRGLMSDPQVRAEIARWTTNNGLEADGIPDAVIPQDQPRTTVPGRDFGRRGDLAVSEDHDQWATYALLAGQDDNDAGWLRAGQALSAMWLVATEWDVAVLPMSSAIEMLPARQLLRNMLDGLEYPYLAVRLGIPISSDPPTLRTPRLPVELTVEVQSGQS